MESPSGALWLATAVTFQPKAYFSVQWTAYMLFMVLVLLCHKISPAFTRRQHGHRGSVLSRAAAVLSR